MTNSYINPTQPTASEPRYSQDAPAWQDVEIVDVPAAEEPEPAEGAPEPIRIIDEPDPGEATAGDAVIEYTRDHLPVEEGGQGMTQQEIAAKLDMAQSTICASIKRETMRRMSEGLEPAAPAPVDETGAIGVLPDNTAIDLGGDRLAADDMNFVEAFRTAAGDANAGLTRLVELMSSSRWQPGSEAVDEIVTRAGRDIKGVLANVGPFMRLVDHDLEDMWPADENDRSRDQDEVNGLFDQILTVASECA